MTMTTQDTITAREYLRVSFDRSGRERSLDEQHGDNARAADESGWLLGEPYRDTGSASRHATKGRDGYDRLVDDLDAGRFGADVLVLWESSRGSRKVGEWVDLIELCERRGVSIAVTTHGPRTYDPANPRDRRNLLEDAVDSEYETSKLSVRIRRSMAANAAAGKPHGLPPFGYRRIYDERSGAFMGQEPDPDEAPIIAELFERLAAGHSLVSIARDFADRGIVSRRTARREPRPFAPATLSKMARLDAYAGLRTHTPGGRGGRVPDGAVTTTVEADWEPIVSRELFYAVRNRLTDPARKTTRPGRGVHLLSMIARCDICGSVMAANYRRGPREYACHTKGCVRIPADGLDEVAEERVLAALTHPDVVAELVTDDGDDEALADARDRAAEIRAELDDLGDRVGAGEVSATLAARAEPGIVARLRAAEAEVAELSRPSALRGLIAPDVEVAEHWRDAPMEVRREIVRLVLSPELVGELRVTRSPTPGHRVPPADRVRWHRG